MSRTTTYILILGALVASAVGLVIAMMLRAGPAAAREPVPVSVPVEDISVGISSTGSGCHPGTARIGLSPSRDKIFISPDAYIVETSPGRALGRAICNIVVPISIPPGLRVSVSRVVFRGYASIPGEGSGLVVAESSFAGASGPSLRGELEGEYDGRFELSDTEASPWSNCGESTTLRIRSSLQARKRSAQADREAYIHIHYSHYELGEDAGIQIDLAIQPC